jgi:riboflavin kinase/FMN adenylyltransferase
MRTALKRIDGTASFPHDARHAAIALGNFDGVHIGHQVLLRHIVDRARRGAVPSVALTFEPHPVKVLAPSQCPRLLMTLGQKLRRLGDCGVDLAVIEPFTRELAALTPENFFRRVIMHTMAPSAIVVGYDFTFGVHRTGTVEILEELGRKEGIEIVIVPAEFSGETLVSSTIIRRMVAEGRVSEAMTLLGAPYTIEGEIVPGRGIGQSLDARTANLRPVNEIIPADGVYVSAMWVEGENAPRPSVTSIGNNPTFPDSHHSIETHVLDDACAVLGKNVSLFFYDFMRETLTFASAEELKAQIARDIAAAREYHASHGAGTTTPRRREPAETLT